MTAQEPETVYVDKAEATLVAEFALQGYAVHALAVGGYLVARWDRSWHCGDLRELASLAVVTGVRT